MSKDGAQGKPEHRNLYARNIYFFLISSDYFIEDSYLIKFTRFCIFIEGKSA